MIKQIYDKLSDSSTVVALLVAVAVIATILTIAMPLLVAWGNVVAMLGGMLISDTVFDVPAEYAR